MWKITQAVLFLTIAAHLGNAADAKNGDEGRPYEFGFTIDGQQHRHEKKDEKGIIQGEFGFITADGIYHTTVYATDENGKFKILSMRSLRISAPLDGSSFKGTISPEANKYRKQAGLAALPEPSPSPNALSLPEETPKPLSTTTVKTKEVYRFTTQPTVKPACAGCGYITTRKPKPGEKFQFQNAFVKVEEPAQPNQINGAQPTQSQQPYSPPQQNPQQPVLPQQPNQIQGEKMNSFDEQQKMFNPQQQNNQQSNQNQPGQFQSGLNGPGQNQNGPTEHNHQAGQGNAAGSPDQNQFLQNRFDPAQPGHPGFSNPSSQPVDSGFGQTPPQEPQPNALGIPNPDEIRQQVQQEAQNAVAPNGEQKFAEQPQSSLPPIEVKDNVINVGGVNPLQIPIKDKFPGMAEGLPEGVGEKDITDLLYKFSYVVGFHGHYEKGLKNGAKVGGYFVNGRDGFSRVVTYVADENGYRPKVKLINLGLDSDETPKPETEKTYGLKSFEFVWYPIK